ncbi:MAG: tryptophan synthase subunit alpha [Flavobacteriales bacterium]|nr:tryptophan synthase subunit alpha [Flavobacteriales bacterium]|tara:strand:+ start:2752 stop:3516 length:765 start_codon:yes stop_codon:yes gene_type:complete
MNRINKVFNKKKNLLSIYFTAGFPDINDTLKIIKELDKSQVDMIEIGLPFSDPLADGPTIQKSSEKALSNGMTTNLLFDQLKDLRKISDIPVVIMGYFNPILQYGIEKFCSNCKDVGIDGLIIPDLPADIFKKNYKIIFEKYKLNMMFLITPQTSNERINLIDDLSKGFIYMVSSYSVTGAKDSFDKYQIEYFKRIKKLNLSNPLLIGFGISNKKTFQAACQNSNGAIIGSAYIKYIENHGVSKTRDFIKLIKD